MNLLRFVVRPYFHARFHFHRLTGSGAFRRGRTRRVAPPDLPQGPPLKRAVWQYHVKQLHDSSCSVATVVACISAIRSVKTGDVTPVDQQEILERVTTGHWKARMSDGGYRGRRGLPLPLLGRVVRDSLAAYGLEHTAVEVVQTPKHAPPGSPVRRTLKKRLRDFDRSGDGLIVAHFDQGAFVPTLNIPHISPVGAYDAGTDRVTILDVDPEQAAPYELGFTTFYAGLSADYHHLLEPFGYGSGGYVYIRL